MHRFLQATVSALTATALALAGDALRASAAAGAVSEQRPIHINAGGPAATFEGIDWQADRWFGGGRAQSSDDAVVGTSSSELYQDRRVAVRGYDIPLQPGTYDVTLHSAETRYRRDGQRVFSARAEGVTVLRDVDLHREVGHDTAYRATSRVVVTDGTLDVDFSARTGTAVVTGISVVPVDGPSPAPAPAPGPAPAPAPAPVPPGHGWPGAAWEAPTLVDPLVLVPGSGDRIMRAPADRDVLIRWPETDLDVVGGFELHGGRNVVSTGGTVRFSERHFPAGADQAVRNRCLHITGHPQAQKPRTVHVEGLHCAGPYVWEGINVDSKGERGNLTVQLRDITIDRVNVELTGGIGKHYGGDALQVWNGPHRLRVDGFDARNLEYQGLFLQPNAFGDGPLGRWELDDVYLQGASSGSGYLMWLAGERTGVGAITIDVDDVWVEPSPGRSAERTLYDYEDDWQDVRIGTP